MILNILCHKLKQIKFTRPAKVLTILLGWMQIMLNLVMILERDSTVKTELHLIQHEFVSVI